MNKKNRLFPREKPKILPIYLLAFALAIWGIGNVLYWEVYKGYSACTICAWHRATYITLFILLLILSKYPKLVIKGLIWISLMVEAAVSLLQVFQSCGPLTCRYVSLNDKLNLTLVSITLILIFIFELRAYLQYKRKINLRVKHCNHFPNIKIGKSKCC